MSGWPVIQLRVMRLVGHRTYEVLVAMAALMRDGNEVDAGPAEIGALVGMGWRQAYRHMRKLEEKGLIVRLGRHWMVNGRVFYRGRLVNRADNIAYFEGFADEEGERQGLEDADPEGEGEGGAAPGAHPERS